MLKKDSVIFGVVVSIASIVLTAALLGGVLFAFDLPFNNNAKLFLFSFVPAILLYSLYAMGYFSQGWIRK